MKRIATGLIVILVILVAAFFALRTPDTNVDAMMARYGGPAPLFADGPGGLRIHYRDEGCRTCPPVILMHGANASLHTWGPIVDRLKDDYRLISFDRRGHGLTGPHPADDYSMDGFLADIDAVAAAVGVERFALVGHSAGGGIAWRYALARPDRVTALGLFNATGAPRAADAEAPKSNLGFRLMASPPGRFLLERITPRSLVRQSLLDSVSVRSIVDDAMVDRYWELLRYPGNRRATVLMSLTPRGPDLADRISGIAAPTLVLWGRDDALVPLADGEAFADLLPDDRFVVLDHVGHIPMEEAPEATAAALADRLATAF